MLQLVKQNIAIKKLHKDAVIPQYQTPGSVGFDFHTIEDLVLAPGEFKLIRTGLAIGTPENYMLALVPRSSTYMKWALTMPNSIGVVDQDYSGDEDEVKIPVVNESDGFTKISKGQRIAQGIFLSVGKFGFFECDSMGESRSGFGSTGVS